MKFRKILKILTVVIIIILAVDAGLIFAIANWQPEIEQAESVIILGAAINTPALTNRTLTGLKLYQEGKANELILSGGKIADSDISEAEFMQKVILSNSADPINFVIEDKSHNTYENIKYSKEAYLRTSRLDPSTGAVAMLDVSAEWRDEKMKDSSVVIVSDKFHLARAVLLAKREGFETVYWKSPEPTYYPKQQLHYYYFREFVAMISYIPKFIFG